MDNPTNTLQEMVDRRIGDHGPLKALEAGCGSLSRIDLRNQATIVGIDISSRQLERNEILSEKIQGDLQTYPLPRDAYDLILCWDVLEHIEQPTLVLQNFQRAVAPGGWIVVKLPNLNSPKGLVTKFTPHAFHVWFYRNVYKWENAGKDDVGPFNTHLKLASRPAAIRRFAAEHGLNVRYEGYWEAMIQKKLRTRNVLGRALWPVFQGLVKVLSLGSLDAERTEYLVVLEKERASA